MAARYCRTRWQGSPRGYSGSWEPLRPSDLRGDQIDDAERWIYDAYDGHETDGGTTDGDVAFDPGEPGVDYGLLEIEIGSATLQTY